jgi:hypothetical protein
MSDDQTDQTDQSDQSGTEQPAPTPGPPDQPGSAGGYSWAPPASAATPNDRSRAHRLLASATTAWVVAALLALAVVGLSVALALGNTSQTVFRPPFARPTPVSPLPAPIGPGQGSPFGGRFGDLGVAGTVTSVGSGSFSVKGVGGQTVTVDEQSSTIYAQGATKATVAAVTTGSRVLVLGSRSGTIVKAMRVIVLPAGFGAAGGLGGAFTGPAAG